MAAKNRKNRRNRKIAKVQSARLFILQSFSRAIHQSFLFWVLQRCGRLDIEKTVSAAKLLVALTGQGCNMEERHEN